MTIFETRRNQNFAANGSLVSEDVVQVDITERATRADIVAKARAALTANQTFLAIGSPSNAQVLAETRLLARQNNGIIRLFGSLLPELVDLLVENTDT